MHLISIWFDGGSLGNPGKGYGSYRIDGGPMLKHESIKQVFGESLTCNQAEYYALIAALKWLKHNRNGFTDSRLEIRTDSMIVRNQVMRKWKCRTLHLKELRDEVLSLLADYRHFEVKWHGRENNVELFGH